MSSDIEHKNLCFMSKITINTILAVLRLVMTLVAKCIRLVYSIMDIVDDGCINAPKPENDRRK